jgi:H+/Cl- antiporter ClcA
MFSGQHVMPQLLAQSATLGFAALIGLAALKLASTAFLLETGFFGGPIFPALFASTALGLAFNDILNAPINLAVAASMAGLITVVLRQPLSAALLTLAITGAVTAAGVAVAVTGAFPVLMLINKLSPKRA